MILPGLQPRSAGAAILLGDLAGERRVDPGKLVKPFLDLGFLSLQQLDLLRPIYSKTTNYGHFGKDDPEITWERTDKTDELKKAAE